ncbi:hypothetical protein H6G04_29995 [Calothrix membranacea FACHB-236]|nr:hypothetical protein [Calothrix membranacea FACHB-236]
MSNLALLSELKAEGARLDILLKLKTNGVPTTTMQEIFTYIGIGTTSTVVSAGLAAIAVTAPVGIPLLFGAGMFLSGLYLQFKK